MRITEEACDSLVEFNKWHTIKGVDQADIGKDVPSIRNVHFLQVDASVLEVGITVLGCVFKDHNKVVTFAACRKEIVSLGVVVAEITAIRWGLMLAKYIEIERIVVQSDVSYPNIFPASNHRIFLHI